nr:MAG TPA: MYM-type zinc finger protein [Caudoviricetes sp.]
MDNTTCPVCGKTIHEAVACPKLRNNVCQAHCLVCEYNMAATPANNQKCRYKEKSSG